MKGYLLVNDISLSNVEQIAIERSIHNTMITTPSKISEKKCRTDHGGYEKHVNRKLYRTDIH